MEIEETCQRVTKIIEEIIPKYSKVMTKGIGLQDVTPSQLDILLFLEKNGPQRVGDIGQGLNMVDSNVSNICKRLEKTEFIERKRQTQDQRVVLIQLRPDALPKIHALKKSNAKFKENMQRVMAGLDPEVILEGLTQFNQLLNNIMEESK